MRVAALAVAPLSFVSLQNVHLCLLLSVGAFSNRGKARKVVEIDLLPEENLAIRDKDRQRLSLPRTTGREEEGSAGIVRVQGWWLARNPITASGAAKQGNNEGFRKL